MTIGSSDNPLWSCRKGEPQGPAAAGLFSAILAILACAQPTLGQPVSLSVSAIADQTAGIGFNVTVTSIDAGLAPSNVTTDTTVTLSVQTGTGVLGGTFSGTITTGSSSVLISGVTYNVAEAGVVLRASATTGMPLAPGDSNAFTVNHGVAHHLRWTVGPTGNIVAGTTLNVTIRIEDSQNNLVLNDDRNITLTLMNPNGAVLNNYVPKPTVGGTVTWDAADNLNITKTGTGYYLRAGHDDPQNYTGQNTTNSNAAIASYGRGATFTITPAAHHHLVFSTEPVNTLAGNNLLPAVRIQDVYNNNCTAAPNRAIQLTIQVNPGGATLNGTTSRTTASGVATWAAAQSLDITVPATGYVLRATNTTAPLLVAAGGSDTVDSAAFDISHNVADHMTFTTQPVNTAAGAALVPVVTIQDAYNNTCTTDNRNITLGFAANPGGATLNGTVTLLSVNGVATWTGAELMNITVAANGYRLRASHGGAAFATSDTVDSNAFNITGGAAHHLAFTIQPTSPTTAGADLTPVVTIQDQYNNTVSADDRLITLTFAANPGGTTLNGTTSKMSVSGVATWGAVEGMNLTVAADGYRLQAAHDGAAFAGSDTVNSDAFNVTAAAAHHLAFITQPAGGLAGDWLLPLVAIQDQYDNAVTGDERLIMLTLMNAGGAALNGDSDLTTTDGVATWTAGEAMNITKPGTNYYLQASHDGAAFGGANTVDSSTFSIAHNVPDHLVFSTQPVNTTAGQALLPAVTIQDAYNNTCTTDNRTITLSISTNPGGAALNGTAELLSVDGVATWTAGEDLRINTAATGYKLRATGGGAFATSDNVDSSAFNIAAITTLSAFTVAPSANPVIVNNPIMLIVTARDIHNNPIPNYVSLQTVNLTSTTAGDGTNVDWGNGPVSLTDHLDGTADLAAGTTFNAGGQIAIDITNRRAESITVTADDPVTPATGTSAAMEWDPWFPLLLHITPPGIPIAGVPFDVDIYVTDQFQNLADVTQNCNIRLRLSAGTGVLGGTIDGTIAAGNNSTTISGVTYNVAEGNVVLVIDRLSGDFLVASTSDPITVAGAEPVALEIAGIASQTAGTPFSVTLRAIDGFGNESNVTADTNVSLQLLLGSGVLQGTTTGTITAGTSSVTINGVELNTSQTGVVIRATRTAGDVLAAGDSNAFLVSPGLPSKLAFDFVGDQAANVAFIVTAQVLDDYDNMVGVTADTDLTVSLLTGTGTLGGTLSRTIAMGSNSIVFSLTYDTAEAGVSLQIDRDAGNVLVSGSSNVFIVNPSLPVRLQFEPISWVMAGLPFSVTVVAVDLAGNEGSVVADTTVQITLNSGNSRLTGTSTGVINAGNGRTTVTGLIYNYAETISLRASSSAGDVLAAGTSDQFTVSAGPATYLRFLQQPVNTDIGTFITVTVEVTDAIGNRRYFPGYVSLSLVSPSGCADVLEGTISVFGVSGLATFDIRVPQPCDGYRLAASAPALTGASSNSFSVIAGSDIVGNSVTLIVGPDETEVSLRYTVSGMWAVAPFRIRWGLEHDTTNADAIDEVIGSMIVSDEAYLQPATHTVRLGDIRPYINGRFQYGDRIAVQIDVDNSVEETREDNNLDTMTPTVNLVNELLKLRPRGDEPTAEVTYVVNSPANVMPFVIRVGLDNDGDGRIDTPIAEGAPDEADRTPGVHAVSISLSSAFDSIPIPSGEVVSLVAHLNPNQEWQESTPLEDNLRSATMSYPVDLVLSSLDHARSPRERIFDVRMTYELSDMPVSEDFTIAFYASTDNSNTIDDGDIRIERHTISSPADKTHGLHTRTFRVSVPATVLPGADFVLKAHLDDGNVVKELNETNNTMAMPRYTPGSTRNLCGLIGSAPLALTALGLLSMKRRRRLYSYRSAATGSMRAARREG